MLMRRYTASKGNKHQCHKTYREGVGHNKRSLRENTCGGEENIHGVVAGVAHSAVPCVAVIYRSGNCTVALKIRLKQLAFGNRHTTKIFTVCSDYCITVAYGDDSVHCERVIVKKCCYIDFTVWIEDREFFLIYDNDALLIVARYCGKIV